MYWLLDTPWHFWTVFTAYAIVCYVFWGWWAYHNVDMAPTAAEMICFLPPRLLLRSPCCCAW